MQNRLKFLRMDSALGNPGAGGAWIVLTIKQHENIFKRAFKTTNNRMELRELGD